MSFIRSFIKELNTQIAANLCDKNACFYSLTQPGLLKDGKRFPIEPGQVEGRKIAPDDTSPIQVYHRLRSFVPEPSEDGHGDDYLYKFTLNLRLYGLWIAGKIDAGCFAGHDDISFAVWSAMPNKGTWEASGAGSLRLKKGPMSTDSQSIINAEFNGLPESKINAMTVGAFTIDYVLTGWMCGDLCDIGDMSFSE